MSTGSKSMKRYSGKVDVRDQVKLIPMKKYTFMCNRSSEPICHHSPSEIKHSQVQKAFRSSASHFSVGRFLYFNSIELSFRPRLCLHLETSVCRAECINRRTPPSPSVTSLSKLDNSLIHPERNKRRQYLTFTNTSQTP